jgi:hypothetical protein
VLLLHGRDPKTIPVPTGGSAPLSSSPALNTKASIRITREGGYRADRVRAYRVFLDKKKVAAIHEAESEELELTPGVHKLQFRIDFCRSRTLELDVKQGEQLAVWCKPNANLLTWPFFMTVGCARYIAIAQRPWR